MWSILLILLVFHFDKSGKDINDSQFENKLFISITFCVSHFDISGIKDNDLQFENIPFI